MFTALWHLGLHDSIDAVYGSSAGSLVGAYFISRQLPYFGTEIYYDLLTTAGQEFIDAQALLRACGLGLLDLRVDSLIKLFTNRMGKPVINLDYLLDTIVQRTKPLDWNTFWAKQTSRTAIKKIRCYVSKRLKLPHRSRTSKLHESLRVASWRNWGYRETQV